MKAVAALIIIAAAVLPATVSADKFNAATDVIVFGRVETSKCAALGDGLVLDGEFTARLTIARIIRGRPPSTVLTIRYIAHTERHATHVSRYHLRRSTDGVWLACRQKRELGYICL